MKYGLWLSGRGLEELTQLTLTKLVLRSVNRVWVGAYVSSPGPWGRDAEGGAAGLLLWFGTTPQPRC